jgi:hypothetical protein
MHERDGKCLQNFSGKTENLEDLVVDRMTLLTSILKK